jgi:two-component system sensor histidine kinase/response regulator
MPPADPQPTQPRILIVDDEVAQMEALCRTLEDHGYDTRGFSSPRNALAAARSERFDLVLADLMMPEMDGIALLRALREVDGDLVGIIMTGEGSIDTAVEAMKSGALDYIQKPFRLSIILPVLARALSVRSLRMENAQLEQRILQRTEELEAANRELESFTSSVSHDLRAPLRHVLGFIGFALETSGPELPVPARRDLESAVLAAKKMDQLISDLLAYSRTGRSSLHPATIHTTELVSEVIGEFAPDLRGRMVDWQIGPLPETFGDRPLLRQVWWNLIGNALKFTRYRPLAVIRIESSSSPEGIAFTVRDNGVGFDMRFVERLFGTFQRLHSVDQFEGNGIGLANVNRIIQRHGGRVWAEGTVGEGAAFGFSLPHRPTG